MTSLPAGVAAGVEVAAAGAVAGADIVGVAEEGEGIEAAVECPPRPADRLRWAVARARDPRQDLRLAPQAARVDPPDRPPAQAAECARERGLSGRDRQPVRADRAETLPPVLDPVLAN